MACGGGGCKGEEESSEYGSGIGQSVLVYGVHLNHLPRDQEFDCCSEVILCLVQPILLNSRSHFRCIYPTYLKQGWTHVCPLEGDHEVHYGKLTLISLSVTLQ